MKFMPRFAVALFSAGAILPAFCPMPAMAMDMDDTVAVPREMSVDATMPPCCVMRTVERQDIFAIQTDGRNRADVAVAPPFFFRADSSVGVSDPACFNIRRPPRTDRQKFDARSRIKRE